MQGIKRPAVAVDAIIEKKHEVLLIKRRNEPFKGLWALPGGFVEYGETTESAIRREVKEETGLDVIDAKLFKIYSNADRDPRGHVISIVYKCVVSGAAGDGIAGDDAKETKWYNIEANLPALAFDHSRILGDYKKGRKLEKFIFS